MRVDLSLRPLIPREETEYWVTQFLEQIKKIRAPRVLDLCAGSGAIGLAVLAHNPNATVTFTDLSPRALKQIKKNLTRNPQFKKRARVLKSNLFKSVIGKFDFILSNPPYIPTVCIQRLSKSVSTFEPLRALDGGVDGMRYIKKIISEAPYYLKRGAPLVVEVDSTHTTSAVRFAQDYFQSVVVVPDQYGRPRTLVLQR